MRAVVLSIGIFAILFPIIARSEPINLVCTLDEHMYAIQFDEAATPPSVHWVGITDIELKVVTLDSRIVSHEVV